MLHTERVQFKQVRANPAAQIQNFTTMGKCLLPVLEQHCVKKEVATMKRERVCVHVINRRNWNVEYLAVCTRTCSKMKADFNRSILFYISMDIH